MTLASFTLCADDYGQNEAVSRGILSLLENKRLSATSCMVNMPAWKNMSGALRAFKNGQHLGLHFNLTEGQACTQEAQRYFGSLNRLIKQAFLRQIDQHIIENELKAQLDLFTQHTDFLPDFIDGHQHIHHLPIIKDALLNVYATYFPATHQPYIRVSSNPLFQTIRQSVHCPKILIITLTGALQLKKQLIARSIPHNETFSGIYDFNSQCDYRKQFQRFLSEIKTNGLIMCHPGFADQSLDPIYATRTQELAYFQSDFFLEDIAQIELQNKASCKP